VLIKIHYYLGIFSSELQVATFDFITDSTTRAMHYFDDNCKNRGWSLFRVQRRSNITWSCQSWFASSATAMAIITQTEQTSAR
jgi:hypothetical protein